jgi:uncharacterized membrane protein
MHFPVWLKLLGIVIVIVGLALKLRTTLVVVMAALVTGLLSGLPLFSEHKFLAGISFLTKQGQEGIIDMLGRAFSDTRFVTLFIVTLPVVGLAERYGLQERSAMLIRRVSGATVGRLQIVYQVFRVAMGALGLRLNGHPVFVRPLIFPMSVGAAEKSLGVSGESEIPERSIERIKAANAASENYGNFYGQNLSLVQAGILLVFNTLKGLGYQVSLLSLVLFAIPIATLSLILGVIQFSLLDRLYRRKEARRTNA